MKKIIIMLMALATLASAEVILGADASYSTASGEVKASYLGTTASDDYTDKMKALTLKAGYQFEQVRAIGYYSLEDYKESEGSKSYGLEVALLIPSDDKTDLLLGLGLGKGELEAEGLDAEFRDITAKAGLETDINESLAFEVGVQYKYRSFDDMVINGVLLEGDERQLGVYVGLNFML